MPSVVGQRVWITSLCVNLFGVAVTSAGSLDCKVKELLNLVRELTISTVGAGTILDSNSYFIGLSKRLDFLCCCPFPLTLSVTALVVWIGRP